MIDRDAFEAWLAHPVTERVLKIFEEHADQLREDWVRFSWHGGRTDELELARLKSAANAYMELADIDYDIIEGSQ